MSPFSQIGCCGAKGSEDYNDALKPVPQECRHPITGIEYRWRKTPTKIVV